MFLLALHAELCEDIQTSPGKGLQVTRFLITKLETFPELASGAPRYSPSKIQKMLAIAKEKHEGLYDDISALNLDGRFGGGE